MVIVYSVIVILS